MSQKSLLVAAVVIGAVAFPTTSVKAEVKGNGYSTTFICDDGYETEQCMAFSGDGRTFCFLGGRGSYEELNLLIFSIWRAQQGAATFSGISLGLGGIVIGFNAGPERQCLLFGWRFVGCGC